MTTFYATKCKQVLPTAPPKNLLSRYRASRKPGSPKPHYQTRVDLPMANPRLSSDLELCFQQLAHNSRFIHCVSALRLVDPHCPPVSLHATLLSQTQAWSVCLGDVWRQCTVSQKALVYQRFTYRPGVGHGNSHFSVPASFAQKV